MAETLRIEIPIETVDETEPELTNLVRKIGKLGEEADKAGKKAKKSTEYVSAFDRQAEKTEKSLKSWAKEKYEILLEAKERITPVLSAIGTGLKSFAGKTWSVTMRAVDLATAPIRGIINLLKNPVFQMGAVLGISIGLADTIDTYKNFEAAMKQVQAVSGTTSAGLSQLTAKAKEMGATTKFTAEESAQAFNYMAMAGWKTGDMLDGIEGILSLAAASGEDLATTSDIVTDALTAFQLKAADAGNFSDVLAAAASNANTTVSMMGETFKYAGAMAGTLGYSIEDVSLMTGLMANSGIKASMAGTSLNSLFTRLSTNAGGAADALKKLKVDFYDKNGNARDLSDMMEELRLATADMNDEQKSNLANTIAGTQAQKGLLAILNASEEDYRKLSEAINHADGAAARMSDTMMDNLQGSITLLQSAVDGVKISFGERLSPYVRGLADWLTGQMPALEQGLNEFMGWVDQKVDRIRRKYAEISGTQEWQEADFFGKVRIAWDEFIAEPFIEWWNSTGKARFAGFAKDIGAGIGAGLKTGIMALLGIDIGETLNEGVSIGASFAKGFSEGFDFEAISEKLWSGFGNMLSNAGKFLPGGAAPDLSSVFSLMMLGKVASPLIGAGKGVFGVGKALFGTSGGGTSLMGSLAGNVSLTGLLDGSAAVSGSGLLGLFGKAGLALGSGATSAGGLAAAGGGAIAGGLTAGVTLVSSAMDAYKALKSDNADEKAAYGGSAAWKAGGVAAGAAAGAAIGSIIPGIGTAVGALIGAGAGGIAGWIKGNKIKEEYQENIEQMQKEAENAQKVFSATGLSIDDIKFKNEALTEAMHDSEVSAEQFALMLQEGCANVAKEAFGDISLSLTEVKKLAGEITFGDMAEGLEEFARATADAEASLSSLQSVSSRLKKENWKVSLGMQLEETDKDSYKSVIENFISASQAYIDDNHYEATAALRLLGGDSADTTGMDSYYASLKEQMEELGSRLTESVNIALEDGVITLDESAELRNLQEQISDITDKLANAQADARMQTIKVKYSGAALDSDSFNLMQQELIANAEAENQQYEDAHTRTMTELNLRRADGAITQEDYDREAAAADALYLERITESSDRIKDFNLQAIADAWDEELAGILPEIEGSTAEKLGHALDNALVLHPEVMEWTPEEVKRWFGLEGLAASNGEAFEVIFAQLKQTGLAVPARAKEEVIDSFRQSLPTPEEIMEAVDFTSLSWADYLQLTGGDGSTMGSGSKGAGDSLLTGMEENYEELCRTFAENIHNYLKNNMDSEETVKFMDAYMQEVSGGMAQFGPVSDEHYKEILTQWEEAGMAYADALTGGASTSLRSGSSLLRSNLQTALNEATQAPFTVTPTINIVPGYSSPGLTMPFIGQHAAGGYADSPQLSWLAEEGYGEFVIPTNPSRRGRALELYRQAGEALGVSAHADGVYIGPIWNDTPQPYTLSADDENDAPTARNANIGGMYESAAPTIQISIDLSPEFVIHGGNGQDEESIMNVVRRHIKEMADEIGGEIAEKLEEVFSNMPLKEA